mgnify:CR=1 FL=1
MESKAEDNTVKLKYQSPVAVDPKGDKILFDFNFKDYKRSIKGKVNSDGTFALTADTKLMKAKEAKFDIVVKLKND